MDRCPTGTQHTPTEALTNVLTDRHTEKWHVSFCPISKGQNGQPSPVKEDCSRLWMGVPLWDLEDSSSWICYSHNNWTPTLCWLLNTIVFYYFMPHSLSPNSYNLHNLDVQIIVKCTYDSARWVCSILGPAFSSLAPSAWQVVFQSPRCPSLIGWRANLYYPVIVNETLLCNTLDW